jgi:tetratricopeptide (TPR) repeat protein
VTTSWSSSDSPHAQTANAFQELLNRAEASSRDRQWSDAAALWSKVVESNPVVASYWNQLGIARYNNKDHRGAIQAYQQAMDLGFLPATMAYNMAECYGALGDKQQALRWLERSLALGYTRPQRALKDEDLKLLWDEPRFKTALGADDVSGLSRVEGWRYDLDFFVRELKRMHPNPYRQISRESFDAYVSKLRNDVPKLNDEQVAAGMMQLAAHAGDGHTYLRPRFLTERGELGIPINYYSFVEGVFVIAAATKYQDLLGAEVLRVGTHAVDEVITRSAPVFSRDNAMALRLDVVTALRSPQLLYGLGLIPEADRMLLTVRDREGRERSLMVMAEPKGPMAGVSLLAATPEPLPISMQPRSGIYWFEYLPQDKVVYFRLNQIRNDEKEPLPQFCERLFTFINEHDVDKLVIDLSSNQGGDGRLNPPLVQAVMRNNKVNQTGKLFVIIGRLTFSAAMDLSIQLERDTKAIFAGEPTGARVNSIGETNPITLPYSKMAGSIASMGGGASFDTRTWIAPRLYTPPSISAYRAKRDPALEAILAYGRER